MLISLGLFREDTVLTKEIEMGEQSIDFMLKRLGPCDSVKMPSIFDKRF